MNPRDALTSSQHLACVRGPDHGVIIPLSTPVILGRQGDVPLVDPYTSRRALRLVPSRHSGKHLVTMHSFQSAAARRLHPGSRFPCGSNLWELRERPRSLNWPLPKPSRRRNWLILLPLAMVSLAIWRITSLPVLTVALMMLSCALVALSILFARRVDLSQRCDTAFLMLCLAAATPSRDTTTSLTAVRVWHHRAGFGVLLVEPGRLLAVVGTSAEAHAQWIASQVSLATRLPLAMNPPVGNGLGVHLYGPDQDVPTDFTGYALTWNPRPEAVPHHTAQIIHSRPTSRLPLITASSTEDLASLVTFRDVGCDPSLTATDKRWRQRQRTLTVPVGASPSGVFHLDIAGSGPHALVAGATGSGKSEALQTWLTLLALHNSPYDLHFVLIDYKGGAGLSRLQTLPHVVQFATDLEPSDTAWLLRNLGTVMTRRKEQLRHHGFKDLSEWERHSAEAPARIIVVIDEFQALGEDHPEFLAALGRLAAQGRSLGIHLILSTQHPGPPITASLRATLDLRIALRCTETADSQLIIGSPAATELPRIPGRAVIGGETIQVAYGEVPPVPDHPPIPSPWPVQLPAEVSVPVGMLANLHQLPLPSQACLLAGPTSVSAELSDWSLGLGHRCASTLHLPLFHLDQMSDPGHCADVFSCVLDQPAVLVITEIVAVLRALENKGVAVEAQQHWAQIVSDATSRGTTLIVSDTQGHPRSTQFPQRLIRFPTSAAWQDPTIVRISPQLDWFRATAFGEDLVREETISPHKGRVLAMGFTGPSSLMMAQLSKQLLDVEVIPDSCITPHIVTFAELVIGPPEIANRLNAPCLPPDQAFTALRSPLTHTFIVEPSIEVIRYLSQRFPQSALQMRARFPYPPGSGLFIEDSQRAGWALAPPL